MDDLDEGVAHLVVVIMIPTLTIDASLLAPCIKPNTTILEPRCNVALKVMSVIEVA